MDHSALDLWEGEGLQGKLAAIRRHLHRYPEVAYEEHETTKAIRNWLAEAGIAEAQHSLGTGLVAEIKGAEDGPVVALRADIDALPIQEETGLPFASAIPGKMHACGHDFHTAAILGAAFLLKRAESRLKGTVKLLFQPAEEKGTGALRVLESGALRGVDAILGLHNKPDLPVGTVGIKPGPLMASVDGFKVEATGVGTHAAVPNAGVDPIVASAHLVTALQTIVSRNVGSLRSAVVSVTRIQSGTTWNVIPDKAILEGTIRTFDESLRSEVKEHFERIVAGVSSGLGVRSEIQWYPGPPSVANDPRLTELMIHAANRIGLNVVTPEPSPAGEDFAFYQREIPGAFVFVGTSGPHEWHHPAFDLDESALEPAARLFAEAAAEALERLAEGRRNEHPNPL
ncbi:hydrolase [Cohnella xylanilytica]|uniref:Amidohydrolase n=1 Tax=Cohnella xylanilytica TaxID=557555 RepID=A0A841U1F8_9BACL|nr:amidohydrolase [Cohnella xylanilytica]MBB6693619.1 amidohydrolase [Cohnella xylanilytica]GIO11440.1 hydrolase [Cohnella xylanilytica]